ncbi:exo-alpha-sialidase [Trypanosoma cruzi]|nr:exo-alpha-sialidase [Trypanosoma cruzi]
MLGSCTVIVPRKAAVPPSLTPQQSAAVPHSPRSRSNNTRDTHPRTVMSPISAMANKSLKCPCSQKNRCSQVMLRCAPMGSLVSQTLCANNPVRRHRHTTSYHSFNIC